MTGQLLKNAKRASSSLALLSADKTNEVLLDIALLCDQRHTELLAENAKDLALMDKDSPLYDRLKLTDERLEDISAQIRKLAELPSPLNIELSHEIRPNGLDVSRITVPFGVIGIIYEARPNVTFDVSAICLKSGNACVLKGSRNAENSNAAIVNIIHEALRKNGVSPEAVALLPSSHEATAELLQAREYVDLIIPRGGRSLIDFVRKNATVNVIETGAGTCHVYFDEFGDLKKGSDIVFNAKTRRVSVCNALDCLIVNEKRLSDLPELCGRMSQKGVAVYADEKAYGALKGKYPENLLRHAEAGNFGKEYLDYAMSVKTVESFGSAMDHIRAYGSGHSEAIVTESKELGERFLSEVDAACVYLNAPTSFSDGAQLGLGAEIGISTQKLHARGPMGLRELTTYKWLVRGNGQVRP